MTIAANHWGAGFKPIVVDLDRDGIELLAAPDSQVRVDLDGDGHAERIGWAAPDDAVLALDANGDGTIDFASETSFVRHKAGAQTDLEGLAGLDDNGDGLISAADAVWSSLALVRDANGNGCADAGELGSLDALGLESIALQREGVPHLDQGNVVYGTSEVRLADGSRHARRGRDVHGRLAAAGHAAYRCARPRTACPRRPGAG